MSLTVYSTESNSRRQRCISCVHVCVYHYGLIIITSQYVHYAAVVLGLWWTGISDRRESAHRALQLGGNNTPCGFIYI